MFFFFYCTTQRVQAAGARHHFLTYFRIWWDTWRLSRDVRAVPDGGAGPFLDAVNRPSLLCLLSSQTARVKGLMNAFVHRTGVRGISPLPENKKTLISKLCNVLLGRTGWLLNQIGKIQCCWTKKKKKNIWMHHSFQVLHQRPIFSRCLLKDLVLLLVIDLYLVDISTSKCWIFGNVNALKIYICRGPSWPLSQLDKNIVCQLKSIHLLPNWQLFPVWFVQFLRWLFDRVVSICLFLCNGLQTVICRVHRTVREKKKNVDAHFNLKVACVWSGDGTRKTDFTAFINPL